MEPVTHFLTGAVLSRTGFNRKTALATVTMTLAAEAPDIDILAYFRGSAEGFMQHRGITHTFIGVPFVAGATVALVWAVDALWQRRPGAKRPAVAKRRWGLLYLFAAIAVLSHLLLDFTNNYGLRPFYPFSPRWYAWDIVFIVEPVMLAALFLALALPWIFKLVGQEIGERRRGPRGRSAAIAALLFIVLLWGVRDYEHRRALAALDAVEYQHQPATRVAAFPVMVNPFRWVGVAEIPKAYIWMHVDSLGPEIDPDGRSESYYKPEPTPATEAARNTPFGHHYINWARFPLVESEAPTIPGADTVVRLQDVRYMDPDQRRHVLEAYILLDSRLHLVRQGFGSSEKIR